MFFDLPSHGLKLGERYTLKILLVYLEGGGLEAFFSWGQKTFLSERCAGGDGGVGENYML